MLALSGGGLILYQAYGNLYAMTGTKRRRRDLSSDGVNAEVRENQLIGPEMVQETTDKLVIIKERLKATRGHQKSYVDNRKKDKLASRYVRSFKILKRIGSVAYRLRLPQELNGIHDTFHVSNLNKYLMDASLHVPLEEINIDKTLRFVKEPAKIVDREIKKFKCSKILIVKVCWNSKRRPGYTWEREDL
nr:putative reverse transcriptase domain-containing protein [Tanacetum cinerariifolium]